MSRGVLVRSLILLLGPVATQATDWPQWRGPNRDGVWTDVSIIQTFPAEGPKVRWRAPVGPGWSSPVVVRGRVYVTDMRLAKPRAWERIQCFRESNGKLLWSRESELVYPEWAFIPEHGGGPAATPLVEDGRIYSLGRNGQVDCLDARNGKVIWEIHLGQKYEIAELSCRGIKPATLCLRLRMVLAFLCCLGIISGASAAQSIARIWDERALAAIRVDTPHPPAQARNYFSLSVCMYDAWAAYDSLAVGYVYRGKHTPPTGVDVATARREAISYAAWHLLKERHVYSRTAATTLADDDALMM